MPDYVPGQSLADGQRQAAAELDRAPKLTRGRGLRAEDPAFESGTVACSACGTQVDAGATTRTGDGVVCDPCHLEMEVLPNARKQLERPARYALLIGLGAAVLAVFRLFTNPLPPSVAIADGWLLLMGVCLVCTLGLGGFVGMASHRRGIGIAKHVLRNTLIGVSFALVAAGLMLVWRLAA